MKVTEENKKQVLQSMVAKVRGIIGEDVFNDIHLSVADCLGLDLDNLAGLPELTELRLLNDTLGVCLCKILKESGQVVNVNLPDVGHTTTLSRQEVLTVLKYTGKPEGVELVTDGDFNASISAQYWSDVLDTLGEDTTEDSNEEPKEEKEEKEEDTQPDVEKYRTDIQNTVKVILEVYKEIFESGYDVLKPLGLIVEGGYFSLKGNKLQFTEDSFMDTIWRVVSTKLGYVGDKNARHLTNDLLSSKVNYFPRFLMDYAFGRNPKEIGTEGDIYNKHYASASWSKYSSNVIEPHLTAVCENIARACESSDQVKAMLYKLKTSLTKCILICEYSTKTQLKVRVVDTDFVSSASEYGVQIDTLSSHRFSEDIYNVIRGGIDAEPFLVRKYSTEFKLVYNKESVYNSPLFAYEALDVLKERGEVPTWNSVIIGKNEDDSIKRMSFTGNQDFALSIIAGTRSGKGVMTLNLLASALGSKFPIFYLDAKPDMAITLTKLSANRQMMACSAIIDNNKLDPEGVLKPKFDWLSSVPKMVRKMLGDSYDKTYGGLVYTKAFQFLLLLTALRAKNIITKEESGERCIFVIDEFQKGLGVSSNAMDSLLKYKPKKSKNKKQEEEPLSPEEEYAEHMFNWFNDISTSYADFQKAELTQGDVNFIFIYQEAHNGKGTKASESTADAVRSSSGVKEKMVDYTGNPLFRTVASTCGKGFIGYNGNFIQQDNPNTPNAHLFKGRYFAYGTNINAITNMASYENLEFFKPFLILNEAGGSFVEELEGNLASLGGRKALSKHITNGDLENPVYDKRIGFEGYVDAMLEGQEGVGMPELLHKSYDVSQIVLNKLGYGGDIYQYLFDFRPETFRPMSDLLSICQGRGSLFGDTQMESKKEGTPINVFDTGVGATPDEAPVQDVHLKEETPANASHSEDLYDDDFLKGRDELINSSLHADRETEIVNEDILGSTNTGVLNEIDSLVSDIEGSKVVSGTNPDDLFSTDILDVSVPDEELSEGAKIAIEQYTAELKAKDEQLNKMLEMLKFLQSKEMEREVEKQRQAQKDKEAPQERLISEPYTCRVNGEPYKMQNYSGKLDIEAEYVESENFEDSAKSLKSISKFIMDDIVKMYGGLDKITEVAVLSNALVFNRVAYSPQINDKLIKSLPIDVQTDVKNGRLAWIFDFGVLRDMTNLTTLIFNDLDFVYKKIRIDLGKDRNFVPKHLFNICPKLMLLQIDDMCISLNNVHEYDRIFTPASRSTEMMDSVDKWGVNATKRSWSSVKDIYRDKNKRGIWKALSVGGMVGVTVGVGSATLGLKSARKLGSFGQKFLGSMKEVIGAMKENR